MYTSRRDNTAMITVPALAAVLIWVASVVMQPISSYASQNISDTLQQDGKVRLIIKFDDIAAGKIAYKLQGRGQVIDNTLNEYILKKIDEKYNLTKLKKMFADKELARTEGSFAREFANYYIIEVDKDEKDAGAICAALQQLSDIDMVEPDLKVTVEATRLPSVSYIPNDYYVTSDNVYWREGTAGSGFPDLWGLQKIQAFEAWDLFGNARTDPGKDIIVAVIDTGVDFSHPDTGGNKWINPDETAGNGVDDDGNGYVDDINGWDFANSDNDPADGHGHGTHCSGTIGAVTNNSTGIAGIAPNVKIMAVKGLSDSGSGYISDLANCLIYAANNGADVLSNSWGGSGSSSTLENAVNYAYSQGCVVVAAAGNNNQDVAGFTPAAYPNVITVAATDSSDVKASFSNYGSGVDVSAPGVSVLSSTGGSYASWSGTSMACPHVSGVAALILSQDLTLTNAEVAQRLKDTADNIYGQNPSWQGKLGTGRINAYKAILAGGPQKHAPVLDPIGNKTANEGELLSFTVSATDADGDPLIYSIADLPGELIKSGDANFFVQSDVIYEGTKALQSGVIDKNQSTSVSKSVNLSLAGTVNFYWKVSSAQNSDTLAFYVDNTKQAEISGEVNWQNKIFNLGAGAHTLKWTYSKNNASPAGSDAGWIDKIIIACGTSESYDFENGQMPSGFITGGNGRFSVQSGTAHQGTYALKAGAISHNQYEYVKKTVTVISGAQLSFWWKVSSEYYYDYLEFYIDNVLQADISGETSWQQKTYTLSAGTHTLKWQYIKDYSVVRGQDTGWVDDIVVGNQTEDAINFEPVTGQPDPLPKGASFDPATRRFTWTPTYAQAGTYPGIRFIVTEDAADKRSDYEDIAITVNNVNRPPVLDPIGNKTTSEMEQLRFTINATDPEGDALTYSASGMPNGASFDVATRIFTWAPSYQQAGIYSKVRFEVTDGTNGGGIGGLDGDTKLLLHFNTGLSDSSAGNHIITKYGGASIDTAVKKFGTGSLNFSQSSSSYLSIPDSTDWTFGSGDFTVDFWFKPKELSKHQVFIGQADSGLSGNTPSFAIGIRGDNKIYGYIREAGRDNFVSSANAISDLNWHHLALVRNGTSFRLYIDGVNDGSQAWNATIVDSSYKLSIGKWGEYNGLYFTGWLDELRISKGIARWTCDFTLPAAEYSEGSGGGSAGNIDYEEITITVLDLNLTPVLNTIGNKTVNEGSLLTFVITGIDQDGDALTYSAANLPSGAMFNAQAYTFSWTPTYTQAGTYSGIHFEVTDGKAADSEDMTIVVSNTNRPPVISAIGNKTVNENSLLEFTVIASDGDGDTLTYSADNLPLGASFDALTRKFNWTPDYTAAGTYANIAFSVTDGNTADTEAVVITVSNVNRKPAINNLTAAPSADIDEGENITIAISASDPDGDSISYFVQNEPEGSGFVNGDFYWTPDYNQAGSYSNITFTAFDGDLYSEPQTITITVANVNDAPVFINAPVQLASYTGYAEAKGVEVRNDYVYVAYSDGRLKALDINNIKDIREVSAINNYRNPSRLEIFGSEIYLIDSGNQVSIVDIAIPSWFYALGIMPEPAALDTAVYENTAYIACGENLALYDITDRNGPQKIEGFDLGKAEKLITKDEYVYAISADEDLKVIDSASKEIAALKNFQGASGYEPTDIAAAGNNLYITKGTYGVICYNIQDPLSPEENGEYYIYGTMMKEISPYNKDRIFILGTSLGNYSLSYLDSGDPTSMTTLWSYSFVQGSVINDMSRDGNLIFTASQNGVDILVPPLDDSYTVEAGSQLKITAYALDPDNDTLSYDIENKPAFAEAEFSDSGDGRATFAWTPTENEIGTYSDITFIADDGYQEVSSKVITINVVGEDSAVPPDENTKLLLHFSREAGFTDSSLGNHPLTGYGNASIDDSIKKFGTGSLNLGSGAAAYLSVPDSMDWTLGSGDFTIDFWFKLSELNKRQVFIGQGDSGLSGNTPSFSVEIRGDNKIYGYVREAGHDHFINSAQGIPDLNWHHVAFVRSGTSFKLYIDGVNDGAQTWNVTIVDSIYPVSVGRWGEYGNLYFTGWLDEVRISNGIARWASNFRPPAAAY